jgi:hypothetical protein
MTTKAKINELNERYKIVLNEFTHIYPEYRVFPDMETISKEFAIDSGNLLELQADFFKLRDEIQSEITKKANHINKMDIQIKILEKKNKKLLKDLTNLENDNAASSGMLNDIQLRYNEYLLGNWILFISLIGVVTLYYKKRA